MDSIFKNKVTEIKNNEDFCLKDNVSKTYTITLEIIFKMKNLRLSNHTISNFQNS